MPRVALHTLGCKVNQYETQKIAEGFRARGFDLVEFSDVADVYVINTCTVTHTADSKSRQAARAAINRNPNASVVLTGCYAETSEDQLKKIDGISMIIGNQDKDRLAEIVVERLYGGRVDSGDGNAQRSTLNVQRPTSSGNNADAGMRGHGDAANLGGDEGATPESPNPQSGVPQSAIRNPQSEIGRTRALVKIQDGCDQFCTYCAVPIARSVMTSRLPDDVLAEANGLAERGYKEIVLTGIRLGRYDHGLVDLIRRIAEIDGIERIRLSSIELTDIPDGLLQLMAENAKVCRHFHLPLQSGHDEVLARMNRPYTTSEFEAFVTEARSLVPDIAITTDIMVGFPGETDEQFEGTYEFAARICFSRAHIFPYSPRPKTAASELKDSITHAEKTCRKTRLSALTARCMHEFAEGLIGQTVKVLVEGKQIKPNLWSGLTDNYVRVAFQGGSGHVGEIVHVNVESASQGLAFGVLTKA